MTRFLSNNQTTQGRVNSAANNNSTLIKAGGTTILHIMAMNASAATKYVRLYNKATAPTVGTDAPDIVIAVPATSSKEIIMGEVGVFFPLGLGLAITGGAARLDNTSTAAGDVQLFINAL